MRKTKQPDEDVFLETAHCKMSLTRFGTDILLCVYSRENGETSWTFDNEDWVPQEEFDRLHDTIAYLALKYKGTRQP